MLYVIDDHRDGNRCRTTPMITHHTDTDHSTGSLNDKYGWHLFIIICIICDVRSAQMTVCFGIDESSYRCRIILSLLVVLFFFFFICSFLAFIYCIYWREKRALCTATWANRPSILHSLPFYVCVCVVFSCEWLTFWPIMECDDSVIGKISAVLVEQQMCAALWYVKRTASAPVMQLGCEKFCYKMWISYSYEHKS